MSVFARNFNQDAGIALAGQFDAPHPANGKARKGQIHADHHTFGIVGDQDQLLRRLEGAARMQKVQHGAAQEQQDRQHQAGNLQAQMRNLLFWLRLGPGWDQYRWQRGW